MTILQNMLAKASLGAKELFVCRPDGRAACRDFVLGRMQDNGGFTGRGGGSDLYYTMFAVQCLRAIDVPLPPGVFTYVETFGDGKGLDFVPLCCLARIRAIIEVCPRELAAALASHIEEYRRDDGGYSHVQAGQRSAAYGCFVALGACQDVGLDVPDANSLERGLRELRCGDGSYDHITPGTAAGIVALKQLAGEVEPASSAWLMGQFVGGGFRAFPGAPMGDLLSTATALHALAVAGARLDDIASECRQFVLGLADPAGGFRGSEFDPQADVEYTFYALLAMGELKGL